MLSSGGWADHAGTEASLRSAVTPEWRVVETGVCKLCSQFGHCSAFPKWLCVYAEGSVGKWCRSAPVFLKRCPCEQCLLQTCSKKKK